MGGPKVTTDTTTYSYFANLAVGLCEGPIGAVLRVWDRVQSLGSTTALNGDVTRILSRK
jgi:hypothetical protein